MSKQAFFSIDIFISFQVAVAATLVNQALQHDPFHRDSLLLLSLILSAQSRVSPATFLPLRHCVSQISPNVFFF